METTTQIQNRESSYAPHIAKNIEAAIKNTINWAKAKNYRIIGDCDYDSKDAELKIAKLTLNQRKKLRNATRRAAEHPTLANSNLFFHFLHKYELSTERVRIKISYAEELSRKAKSDWKAAQKIADELLKIYKEAKKNLRS